MNAEFHNTQTNSRLKFMIISLKKYGVIPLGMFCSYLIAPEEVKTGSRHSTYLLSWDKFVVFSSISIAIIAFYIFWSRIVTRIKFSSETNTLEIDVIGRFHWGLSTKSVLLSKTQIQTEHTDEFNNGFMKQSPPQHKLFLTHPSFGTITVGENDFENIFSLVRTFEQLKYSTAAAKRKRFRR